MLHDERFWLAMWVGFLVVVGFGALGRDAQFQIEQERDSTRPVQTIQLPLDLR